MTENTYQAILAFLKENDLYKKPTYDDSKIMCTHGESGILVGIPSAAKRTQGCNEVILITATTAAIYYKVPPTNYSSLSCHAKKEYESQEELKTIIKEWISPESGCW